jgi:hypothetical protein
VHEFEQNRLTTLQRKLSMRFLTHVLSFIGLSFLPSAMAMAAEFCELQAACSQNQICVASDDTAAKGAWAVGAKTVRIGALTVEVWYPSVPSTEALGPKTYDIRQWLPVSEQKKIPDDMVPPQVCDCIADLPLDNERGPYPLVIFAHGTAAFRTQSLSLMTQLASRGFVVLAADHPGLYLADLLQFKTNSRVAVDLTNIVKALRSGAPELGFLAGHVQTDRLGLIGHSAGGSAISNLGESLGVSFLVPMASGGVQAGSQLKSTLVLGALDDRVVPYSRQRDGFLQSPEPKRLLGFKNAGHLAFSDLCALKNQKGEDLVAVAKRYGIANAGFATRLWDGCGPNELDPLKARALANYSVTAAAEEALQCVDRTDSFARLLSRFNEIAEFTEQLGPL